MSERHLILVVEDDDMLAEMLESAIELHRHDLDVHLVPTPEHAVEFMRSQRPSAVVTELKFSQSVSGPDFVLALASADDPLPYLVLTDALLHEVPRQVKARYIVTKPLEMDSFLQRLEALIAVVEPQPLQGMSPQSLLQVLHQDRKSCTIQLSSSGRTGSFHLRDGALIHAETGVIEGKEAAFTLLSWTNPAIAWRPFSQADQTIHEPLESILMQWCVRNDHCAA